MEHDDIVETLNRLIETAKDGEHGFRRCAANVKSELLRERLQRRADEYRDAAAELRRLVLENGGAAADHGSAGGALQRGWVAIKGAFGSGDAAMLEACERGEDVALVRYRKAAEQPLPEAVRSVVLRQLEGVQRHHAEMQALREQARAAAH
jgi:uncharacterized protein (TIGR02284 family)